MNLKKVLVSLMALVAIIGFVALGGCEDDSGDNDDNNGDNPGVTIGAIIGNTTEEGGMATFTVVLNTEPTADVTVTPASSDTGEGTVSGALTFTTSDWDTPQTVTVTGVDDAIDDNDTAYQITFAIASADSDYNGLSVAPVAVMNDDDETPTLTLSVTDAMAAEADTTDVGVFALGLTDAPQGNVTVVYGLSGTATPGDDFTMMYAFTEGRLVSEDTAASTFVVAIGASGSANGTLTIVPVADSVDDFNETVIVRITSATFADGSTAMLEQPTEVTMRTVTIINAGDDHSNTRTGATTLSVGGTRTGTIETGSDVDYFSVVVSGSGTLTVYTTSNIDTVGSLEDSSGRQLATNDDVMPGSNRNFRIEQSVTAGTYYIIVSSFITNTGSYTLHAEYTERT